MLRVEMIVPLARGTQCIPPIASITTNTAWLYTEIASCFIIDTYSIFDIIQVIPDEAVGYKSLKKNMQAYLDGIKSSIEKR